MKKRIVVIGTGMGAAAAYRLINQSGVDMLAFADNDESRRGEFCGRPVLSVEEAVSLDPDAALVAIMGDARSQEVSEQLRALDYGGEIRRLYEYRTEIDIRAGAFELAAREIERRGVEGDAAELGVYKGEFASRINAAFPNRRIFLFDTFEGFDERDVAAEAREGYSSACAGDFADTSVEGVLSALPHPDMAVVRKGFFPETAFELAARFAFVSLDADLYGPTYAGLCTFYPLLSPGGVIMAHDCTSMRFKGAGEAMRRFCAERGLFPVYLPDIHGTAVLVKP